MKTIRNSFLALLAFASAGIQSASAAGLLISIDDLQQAGGSGSFELLLTNTEASVGTTYNVLGFSFEMLATPGTDLMFTAADYPTSGLPPYIFEGTGQTTLDPSIPLSTNTFPTNDVTGSDVEFTFPSIPVAPGDMFSLALISFTSTSTVSVDGLESLIVRAGTILADENGQSIPYSLPVASVPEPSTVLLMGTGAFVVLSYARYCRRRRVLVTSCDPRLSLFGK